MLAYTMENACMSAITPSLVLDYLAALRRLPHSELEVIAKEGHAEGLPIVDPQTGALLHTLARTAGAKRVLEIGTGSGYQAAVLAYLGAEVTTIERNGSLAGEARERLLRLGFDSVRVIDGDGTEGYPAGAPYQAILVAAAAPRVPPPLIGQLADGGRLVMPVGDRYRQDLELIYKIGKETSKHFLDPCQFIPLVGKHGWPGPK